MPARPPVAVRRLEPADWPQVAEIYAAGIAAANATFETAAPSWAAWDAGHRGDLRFVAAAGGHVAGWAGASDVSDRCCYAGVVEDSVYVRPGDRGQGVGRLLLTALLAAADAAGIWTVQAGVFPDNAASVALHRACGFRFVGRRERLGRIDGSWRDVLLMERRLPEPGSGGASGELGAAVPIGCSLTAAQAAERVGDWREVLARLALQAHRVSPERLRIGLAHDEAGIAALVLLARQEKACCPFFDFSFEVGTEAVALVIGVPPGAGATLDDFARLAGDPLRVPEPEHKPARQ
jgi:phosphinothricin acetyltransferase